MSQSSDDHPSWDLTGSGNAPRPRPEAAPPPKPQATAKPEPTPTPTPTPQATAKPEPKRPSWARGEEVYEAVTDMGPIDPDTESLEPFEPGDLDPSELADLPVERAKNPPPISRVGGVISTARAPAPVGAYPHARRVGELLFLSGVGPRQPGTNAIPGGPIRTPEGEPRDYDAAAQTRAVIENVKVILEDAGSSLEKVVDVTAFLIDMERDFAAYNGVYAEYFTGIQATRTTIAIRALPTPIAVEFKVIALA
ncbi:MAG: Rid family hydrolase [Planctomycetota bacterium]